MAMSLTEIRESGLLELYIIGNLSLYESKIVDEAISNFPVLKQDLYEIEQSLAFYSKAHSIPAPPITLSNILNELGSEPKINKDSNNNKKNNINPPAASIFGKLLWPLIFAITFAVSYWTISNLSSTNDSLEKQLASCLQSNEEINDELIILEQIRNRNNNIVLVDATEKYPETKLIIHDNQTDQKTFIQVQNLPELASDQSFQLWSLKADSDPIPLDVFQRDSANIFEVQHVSSTNAYAITIEQEGGSTSPTLEQLIGVFSISG